MKILILVLSYKDNGLYSAFTRAQESTWNSFDVKGIETYFYFGDSKENKIVDNNIYTKASEGIENCGFKTIECLEVIKEMNFDYVFRTNSSSYVNKNLLLNFLANKPRSRFYSGIIGDYQNVKFASGSGYILSKDLVDLILLNRFKWDHSFIDDVALGKLLYSLGILPILSLRYDIITTNWLELIFAGGNSKKHFHIRLKSKNRIFDLIQMKKIYFFKNVFNW